MSTRSNAGFLGSRVGARLFGLFVVSALLPLALSDWLAASAVADLANSLQTSSQTRATRQVGLQVFDRLTSAKTTLVTLPPDPGGLDATLSPAVQRVFSRLVHLDPGGRADWPANADAAALANDWQRADPGETGLVPLPIEAVTETVQAFLRIAPSTTDQPPRILMALATAGRVTWLAEIHPDHVWEPLESAAIDSGWQVLDSRQRSLTTRGDPELLPSTTDAATPRVAGDVMRVRTGLFLGAEFGSGAWEFIEQRPAPQVRWQGISLMGWLALVALGTVLLIALVSQRTIRRMLVPLQQLTQGTRRLAGGDNAARVAVVSDDEFGSLGLAFNEMAARIEVQFDSLEALSAVDRDVLAGTSIVRVVHRVLEQLQRLHPAQRVAVAWLSADHAGQMVRMTAGPGQSAPLLEAAISLAADDAQRFSAIETDQFIDAGSDDADTPWCRGIAGEAGQRLALLPLGGTGATGAVLMVGALSASEPLEPKSARELRDRLAVAFSVRERERLMVFRAVHDSLTGLSNRAGLGEFVEHLLDEQGDASHAALFIDLDHFKDVNDSLGHQAGDLVLCEVAARLRQCAPPGALVARQGGDEFVLVLPGVDELQACAVAASVVGELDRPFDLRGERHSFGASVGVALYPRHGADSIELMRHADLAMFAAKQGGRSRFAVFNDSLEAAAQERLRIPRELRRDMELGKLIAYYQARVDPIDGRVSSAEALVRWQHPERGLVFPDQFIALAEESSLIDDLGNWMINEACSRMAHWRTQHPSLRRVSVNVSARQLASGRLPSVVRDALQRHGLAPDGLELEITESLLAADGDDVFAQLNELRTLGVSIALDDFGTGFSSMAMLRKLPIDVMKIDRAFVKDLDTDDAALAITRSIAALARSLKLHLVAEGVENETQADMLRDLGCDEFQGYLYSKPLPPGEFSRLCRVREPASTARQAA